MKKMFKRMAGIAMAATMAASMAISASAACSHSYVGTLYGEPHYSYSTCNHPVAYTENGVTKYTYVDCTITTTIRLLRQTCMYCGHTFTTSTTTGSTHSVQ